MCVQIALHTRARLCMGWTPMQLRREEGETATLQRWLFVRRRRHEAGAAPCSYCRTAISRELQPAIQVPKMAFPRCQVEDPFLPEDEYAAFKKENNLTEKDFTHFGTEYSPPLRTHRTRRVPRSLCRSPLRFSKLHATSASGRGICTSNPDRWFFAE